MTAKPQLKVVEGDKEPEFGDGDNEEETQGVELLMCEQCEGTLFAISMVGTLCIANCRKCLTPAPEPFWRSTDGS